MQLSHELLQQVLLQLAAIVAAARLGGWIFSRLGQPEVVGEIVAGLLLGPSVLGRFGPVWLHLAPTGDAAASFRVLSELGLVLLMFLIGLDFDFRHLHRTGRAAAGVAVAGIAFPFALGAALAVWLHPRVAADVPQLGFVLFVATALSITAIPILGRIMLELGINRTRLGVLTITAAAVDDVLGWILLAGVSALVRGGFRWEQMLLMFAANAIFVLAIFCVVGPVCRKLWRRLPHSQPGGPSFGVVAGVLVVVLLSAASTHALGVFAAFGPFVLGAALSSESDFSAAIVRDLRPLVYALLLPIFFTHTGLHTDVGLLDSGYLWMLCGLVIAVATVGKMAGCGVAARLGGLSWSESSCIAVMMNTRALMGLVAINVGRELGVVPPSVFSMLVLMAIFTTLLTTPVLRRLLPHAAAADSIPTTQAPLAGTQIAGV